MKEPEIKLFNQAIHDIKRLMSDLADERKGYHKQMEKLTRLHDIKINKMLRKSNEILGEFNELFEKLYEECAPQEK